MFGTRDGARQIESRILLGRVQRHPCKTQGQLGAPLNQPSAQLAARHTAGTPGKHCTSEPYAQKANWLPFARTSLRVTNIGDHRPNQSQSVGKDQTVRARLRGRNPSRD
jgi:hypothetical protein